jgi:hypothetical protein
VQLLLRNEIPLSVSSNFGNVHGAMNDVDMTNDKAVADEELDVESIHATLAISSGH